MGSLTIFVALIILIIHVYTGSDSKHLRVPEGESAHLHFAYPCDATRVTLQYANRLPFYSSANPVFLSLPRNHNLTNVKVSQTNQCFVSLNINPVLRDNEGTYILTAYKNGHMLPDYPRVGLRVNYPPGKASCESTNDYNDGEWVSLTCQASVGTQAGHIVCYQNGMRLPSLTKPVENRQTFNQIILSQSTGLVYGCSSTVGKVTDICQCKDFCWDPIQNMALTDFPDPCPVSSSMPDHISSTKSTDTSSSSSPLTDIITEILTTKNSSFCTSLYWLNFSIALCLTIIIFVVLYLCKIYWEQNNLSSKLCNKMRKLNKIKLKHKKCKLKMQDKKSVGHEEEQDKCLQNKNRMSDHFESQNLKLQKKQDTHTGTCKTSTCIKLKPEMHYHIEEEK